MRILFLVAWVLLLPLAEAKELPVTDLNALLSPGKHRMTLSVGGQERTFIFVTPKGFVPGKALPLVFFFHGAGGTAEQAVRTYGWAELAEAENFFVAFPQGLPARPDGLASFLLNPNIWRDQRAGMKTGAVNDVQFFEELLVKLEVTLPVDRKRIYVAGFSNGAGMTFTLGSRYSDRIAAIAPVSSQSFVKIEALARPLPVYYLTGTADPLIPFHGGMSVLPWGQSRSMPPVQDSVDTWVKLDGCPTEPAVVSDADGVKVLRYGPGRGGSEVIFTTVEGNGHHWPGTKEPLPKEVSGPALDPFEATSRIWEFFVRHPMTEGN